jgi:hypothetical protein
MKTLVTLAMILTLAGPVCAQQAPPSSPPTMPPVRVEGERVPDERTESPERAREELERTPGGVGFVGQPAI